MDSVMISDDELDNLPSDHAQAFVELENILRERTESKLFDYERINMDTDSVRRAYVSGVIAAAKEYEIEGLENYPVPNNVDDIRQFYSSFLADVDLTTMQLRIRIAKTRKRYSVSLEQKEKSKIHHYIQQIRAAIDEANIEESKRNKLFEKLNDFAAEVDKSRTTFQCLSDLFVTLCATIGDGVKELEPARKWLDSIAGVMGKTKEAEEQFQELTHAQNKKITGPRKQIAPPIQKVCELDDEVPF